MSLQGKSSENAVEKENHSNKGLLKYKICKTLLLFEIWIAMGVNSAIVTPSLIDLSELMDVNIAQMSLGCFVARSVGMVFGGPIGGIVADKNRKHLDLLLALSIGLMCLSTAVVPLVPWFALAAVLFAFTGFTGAALGATGNPMILSMWGKKAAAPLQFMHGGFGIGLTITPLFMAPFLSKNTTHNVTLLTSEIPSSSFEASDWDFNHLGFGKDSQPLQNLTLSKSVSQIYIPYAISGAMGIFGAIGMLMFYCRGAPGELEVTEQLSSRTWKQVVLPSTYSPGRPLFGALMAVGLYFMYVGIVGKDVSLGSFITTYAVQQLNVSKPTASFMTTAYFASYTLGRYVSMLAALCVPVYISLMVAIIANLALSIALVLAGLYNPIKFWIVTLLFGFFAGPIYPLGMAWTDQYIEVTPVVVSVIDLGISTGYMLCTGVGSYLYQYISPTYIMQIALYFSAFLLLVTTLLLILGYRDGKRSRYEYEIDNEDSNADSTKEHIVDEHSPLIN